MGRTLVQYLFHSSLGITPFQALYGREPPALLRYNGSSQDPLAVREVLHDRQMLLDKGLIESSGG